MSKTAKLKYIVWQMPEVWPEGITPHWWMYANVATPEEAFLKHMEASKDGEAFITQRVELKVVLNVDDK